MARYMINGEPHEAATHRGLVEQMRDGSFTQSASLAAFMVATAARASEQFGTEVRSDTTDHFVADLIKVGLIKEM